MRVGRPLSVSGCWLVPAAAMSARAEGPLPHAGCDEGALRHTGRDEGALRSIGRRPDRELTNSHLGRCAVRSGYAGLAAAVPHRQRGQCCHGCQNYQWQAHVAEGGALLLGGCRRRLAVHRLADRVVFLLVGVLFGLRLWGLGHQFAYWFRLCLCQAEAVVQEHRALLGQGGVCAFTPEEDHCQAVAVAFSTTDVSMAGVVREAGFAAQEAVVRAEQAVVVVDLEAWFAWVAWEVDAFGLGRVGELFVLHRGSEDQAL